LNQLGQAANPARTLADLHRSVRDQSNPSRIVSSVLKTPQPIHQNRCGFDLSDVTDDSAHKIKENASWRRFPPGASLRLRLGQEFKEFKEFKESKEPGIATAGLLSYLTSIGLLLAIRHPPPY
jgi:hypothetical protein